MNDITFGQAWEYGGSLMWVLAAMSVFALATILYLWVVQMRFVFVPSALKRLQKAKDVAAEGRRIAARAYAAVDWLADVAAIAPLVGLLGTVLGMFKAFGGIASDVAAGAKPVVLAQGVSQAIVTTIFGLVVAIPCLVVYALFRRRCAKRVAELEEACEEIGAGAPAK
jgi:biopolymer transport protein ExbB/TolQ